MIKVDVSSKIAKDISTYSIDIAKEYLSRGLLEKGDSLFESDSSASAYSMSLNLVLKAFGGLIKPGNNYEDDLNIIFDLIDIIPSSGERIRLYSVLAIKFFEKKDTANFKEIYKKHVITPLNILSKSLDQDYYYFIFKFVCPALYLYHSATFYSFVNQLHLEVQQASLMNTCSFLLKGIYPDEYFDSGTHTKTIDYEVATDVVLLIEKMNSDNGIYVSVKDCVSALKDNREISVNQKNIILTDLTKIINSKLPNLKSGIQHDGYRLLSNLYIDSLKGPLDRAYIDSIVADIFNIPNASDRTLLLHSIAKELKFKSNSQRLEILLLAFSEAKKIPSTYDMMVRYEEMLPTMAEIDKTQFKKMMEELFFYMVNDKEDENIYSKHEKLIDLLHQHDPKNIANYINILDKDPARNKKDSRKMKDQIALLDREKTYFEDIKKAKKFGSPDELSTFSFQLMSKLQTGEFTPKEPMDTIDLLEAATKCPLSEGYNTFSFCIENVVQKYQRGTKNNDILRSVYEATIFNVKLISTLTQSSILKMRNRYSIINRIGKGENRSFFHAGERDRVILYIKNWVDTLEDNQIVLIDPYFKIQDVDFIKIIKEIKPETEVFILTSKEGVKNIVNYEDEYANYWGKISVEPPPTTTIKIVWIDGTEKTPFHDRYIVSGCKSALRLGSSYGSLGVEKDAEISVMTVDQISELEDSILKDYVYGSKNYHKEKRLKYKTFTL